jgi:3-oxoacyl-[acyl-carrier protein] reductase
VDSELQGRTVLITGASGGIGAVTARAFSAEGARVVAHHHRGRERAEQLAGEIGALALRADLRDAAQVDALFAQAIAAQGRIDALVVNAGIWIEAPAALREMTLEQWQATIDTDLTSAFLTCRAFLRHLADAQRECASIVLVASTAALFGEADHADYAAAKAALAHGLTPTLKNEIVALAPRGRVNCVCPGWVRTAMTERSLGDAAAVQRRRHPEPMRVLHHALAAALLRRQRRRVPPAQVRPARRPLAEILSSHAATISPDRAESIASARGGRTLTNEQNS